MQPEEKFEVDKLSETHYRSKYTLCTPKPELKPVYGGNFVAQGLLIAIRSSPAGFVPHSLHSYFVKAGSDKELVDWEVEKVSDGKSFCNRILKAKQNGVVKYIITVSLTTRNSQKKIDQRYAEFQEKKKAGEKNLKPVALPVTFRKQYPEVMKKYRPEDIDDNLALNIPNLSHKVTPEMYYLNLTPEEVNMHPTERRLSYFIRWGEPNGPEYKVKNFNEFKYAGLGFLSDSLPLPRLTRVLRMEKVDHRKLYHYFSVSLDHSIYFHDDDFDPTKWMTFAFTADALLNDRTLLRGEFYNKEGKLVASIIQEGIVLLGNLAEQAKL